MKNKKKFSLFANCKLVLGNKRATICDLQRNQLIIIPLNFANYLLNSKIFFDNNEFVKEIKYLIDNEFGFHTTNPDNFPKLDNIWKSPEIINNSIIEIENLPFRTIDEIIQSLSSLFCKFIELRFYKSLDIVRLKYILDKCNTEEIKGVFIYAPIKSKKELDNINNILIQYDNISLFIGHSAKKIINLKTKKNLILIERVIDDCTFCGLISKDLFSINIPAYMESLSHNTCLNKKVSIDGKGNIKNCPSMKNSFGNVLTDKIEEIVSTEKFQELWFLNKDKIKTCKDCEFRRVCTDCRAYLNDPTDIYSQPLKCGYNPYTNQWKDWFKIKLKRDKVDFYKISLT